MEGIVSQEDASFGLKLQLVRIVGVKVWPTSTSKGPEKTIVRMFLKNMKVGGITFNDSTRHAINVICGSQEASSQYLRGIDAYDRKDRPVSAMCRCLRSIDPFC
jgi:hypothetical protein